jgi:3-hydroxybutyryl-CoA dehydrogenase
VTGLGSAVQIGTVAVIGAGLAGRSFAAECVAAGYRVVLEDVMPANLRQAQAELQDAGAELELALTVEEAVRDADIAVDFMPDELESKLEIFSMMDRMAPPRTILCTPTDALSISDLASCVYRPERSFGVRGGLISIAVQLVHPPLADARCIEAVRVFLLSLGRSVSVQQDSALPMLTKNLPTVAG